MLARVRPLLRPSLPPVSSLLLLLLLALPARAEGPRLSVQPMRAKPGDPVLVRVEGVREAPTGTLAGRALHFVAAPGGFLAVTGLPVEQAPGALAVTVQAEAPPSPPLSAELQVVDPAYPASELKVDSQFVDPPPELKARIQADQEALARAYGQPSQPLLFQGAFAWPRKAKLTAHYGQRRTFNGQLKSQHYGADLDGRIGAPVAAANAGTVVLVRDCLGSGQTVLLHHGAGLYTAYFHLSEVLVKEGQQLARGQPLGKVGNTGRVTGPHLHWGAKADGLWVDPETLLALPFP
ncbi:M23 family metallopeptidase [Aggregicoccus sp. 17bor-14]|nr:M23 family metallopeptidase [Simulacricoccus sp. 17bor-14]MRI87161.1 M23 family metallopeptidase [Aggregicoccus sp. 17bor-14]